MSLENITQQYDSVLDNLREFYAKIKEKSPRKREIIPQTDLQIQDRNSNFKVLKADSIDDILNSGGIVMNDGKTYGNEEDVSDAKYLKGDFEKYKQEIGDAIKQLYGQDAKYDGYAFLDLGENTYAAHIEVDGKKILAVNKNHHEWMEDPSKKREVYGHESMHNIGERTELGADEKNINLNNHLAKKLEFYLKDVYQEAANNASQRIPQDSYSMACTGCSY